jgi:hypothetical protein
MSADDSKSDICFMWLQSKPVTDDEFEWSLWKPADRDRIVKAWTDKLQADEDAVTPIQTELRTYFRGHVQSVADNLSLKLVTDPQQAAPLMVPLDDKTFVYFGAMTASCVHIACWLVLTADDMSAAPSVCCCFLSSSYTQKSDELGEIEIADEAMFNMSPGLTGAVF